jgi:hypothetical protein
MDRWIGRIIQPALVETLGISSAPRTACFPVILPQQQLSTTRPRTKPFSYKAVIVDGNLPFLC